jgi:hypothetical protein
VQLRNHPLFEYGHIRSWPPVWVMAQKDQAPQTLKGEVGVLRLVYANPQISNKCYLVIQHEDMRYVGCVIFDKRSSCRQMIEFLRLQTGRRIQEIGDLDVSFTYLFALLTSIFGGVYNAI